MNASTLRSVVVCAPMVALLGCVSPATYTPPIAATQPAEYERVIDKSFDDTWASLIDYTSQAFFSIDRFEKASGLMTLTFGATDPARFIDCGWLKDQGVDKSYVAFLRERYAATLDGKMNLVVRSLDAKRTQVRVNARYILIAPAQGVSPQETWAFDSGGQATVNVAAAMYGTTPSRTCRPTYDAEKAVLDAVAR